MKQYSNNNPSGISFFVNKVGIFDEYVALTSGDNESSCLIGSIDEDNMTGTGTIYTVSRTGSAYGSQYYVVSKRDVTNEPIQLTNEYYVYSNVGIGQSYSIPHHSQLSSVAVYIFLACYIFTVFVSGGIKLWRRIF